MFAQTLLMQVAIHMSPYPGEKFLMGDANWFDADPVGPIGQRRPYCVCGQEEKW